MERSSTILLQVTVLAGAVAIAGYVWSLLLPKKPVYKDIDTSSHEKTIESGSAMPDTILQTATPTDEAPVEDVVDSEQKSSEPVETTEPSSRSMVELVDTEEYDVAHRTTEPGIQNELQVTKDTEEVIISESQRKMEIGNENEDRNRKGNEITIKDYRDVNYDHTLKGIHAGLMLNMGYVVPVNPCVSVGYLMRKNIFNKFYLDGGAGCRITLYSHGIINYFGPYGDVGAGYYFFRDFVGMYLGIGVEPFWNIIENFGWQVIPYLQCGINFPHTSQIQGLVNFRVGQNVVELKHYTWFSDYYRSDYPLELSINASVGF
jgi:hypothetical protein